MSTSKMPNGSLRYYRERRNWTQEQAAEALLALCGPGKRGEVNARMISKWERGVQIPSLEYRDKLCKLYEVQSPEELGFLKRQDIDVPIAYQRIPTPNLPSIPSHSFVESQEEVWLTHGTRYLAQLFDDGWTLDSILASVKIVLQAMSGMPSSMRPHLFSDARKSASLSLNGKRVSEEELAQLHHALGESIGAGWKLFHTASNTLILALGQTQLSLVQQIHPLLYPSVAPYLYQGLYNLIGMALHFQDRNVEALRIYHNGHLSSIVTKNPLYIAQNLICQADVYLALGMYTESLHVIKEALYGLGEIDNEHRRAKAHLLSCCADVNMTRGEFTLAQKNLDEAAQYIDDVTLVEEEFDSICWLQLAGKRAILVGHYQQAIDYLEKAMVASLPCWRVRHAGILTLLAIAYARHKEREKSLSVAQQVVPTLAILNAPMTNRYFLNYIQDDILKRFPSDNTINNFVVEIQQYLPHLLVAIDKT